MASEKSIQRWRRRYARLIRLYPTPYHQRFGEGMQQTFCDLCRERVASRRGLLGIILWIFAETSIGIIRENWTSVIMKKNIIRIAIGAALILLIPLVMTIIDRNKAEGDGWHWSVGDFIFGYLMLFGFGVAYEMVARRSSDTKYKVAVGIAVVATFLLLWVNAAVGIIGDDHPINMLYVLIFAIGFFGAIISRLQPQGMARTLIAMAVVQMVIPVVALYLAPKEVYDDPPGLIGVFTLNAVFAMLFVGSALLFRQAAGEQEGA